MNESLMGYELGTLCDLLKTLPRNGTTVSNLTNYDMNNNR